MNVHSHKDGPRVLLFGANGQVGGALLRAFHDHPLVALDRTAADFSKPESLRELVRTLRPSVILNGAAYTAVDRAESEPELADTVNHQAAAVLAEEAERAGAWLIHYSTDYIFDGNKEGPWLETDAPAPLNVYGRSKLAGEQAIARVCQRHIILRTSWVYGERGSNFLRTMLRLARQRPTLKIVNDQWGAPTSSAALADATRRIVDQLHLTGHGALTMAGSIDERAGIYHATCAGQTSWYHFAEAIFQSAASRGFVPTPALEGIPSANYPTPAQRPRNSVLSNRKLEVSFGIQLPHWSRALDSVLDQLAATGELMPRPQQDPVAS